MLKVGYAQLQWKNSIGVLLEHHIPPANPNTASIYNLI